MIRVAVAPFGLKSKSYILTRRGGKDANAPERPQKAILRDWHVGSLGPTIFHCFGDVPKIIQMTNMNIDLYGTRIGRNEQWMHRSE